jgi:hypothetical protein
MHYDVIGGPSVAYSVNGILSSGGTGYTARKMIGGHFAGIKSIENPDCG